MANRGHRHGEYQDGRPTPIPEHDLNEAMREADVVVAHAGVGAALAAFEAGKCPVLVPRRHALGEHVDDHQTQIATELGDRGLAVSVEADDLTLENLHAAATRGRALAVDPPFITGSAHGHASGAGHVQEPTEPERYLITR